MLAEAGSGDAHVGGDTLDSNGLSPGLLLLQPQHASEGMGTGADQDAAASLVPLASHGGAGAFQALLTLHEQHLALLGADDLSGLLDRSGIDEVLGVQELLVGRVHHFLQLVHDGHDLSIHLGLLGPAHILLAGLAEIAGERLLTDDMLAGLQGLDGHGAVEERRGDDVDDIDLRVCQHIVKVSDGLLIAIALLDLIGQIQVQVTDGLEADGHSTDLFIAVAVEMRGIAGSDGADDHGFYLLVHRKFLLHDL